MIRLLMLKVFEFERLYNSEASRIRCQAVGGIKAKSRDATDWMEWQVNTYSDQAVKVF